MSTFSETLACLEAALAKPLPGIAAHRLLAPRPRRAWPPDFSIDRIRHAAGLVLVYADDDGPRLVLTVRAGTLGRHGGQVSLPGGAINPGETHAQAALREAYEEIALRAEAVRVLGELTPIDIPVSGFRLHPVVAATWSRPALAASDEVARILDVDVGELFDPASLISIERLREGRPTVVPAFRVGGVEIWGATAMILAEFLWLLGWRFEAVR
jgi:8-oxo-dGTP pyrophosphatase MutT (NUDIX family)